MSTSNTSKQPEEPIYFVDRTHGRKRLPNLLKKVGMKVEVHYAHFDPEEPDDEWIPKAVANGWVILTGDKAIETDPINLKAVEDSAAKVFITSDTNSKAEEWAAAVIVGRRKMARLVDYNDGAFFVDIAKDASGHISGERYKGSGGPKPREQRLVPPAPDEIISATAAAGPEPLPNLQQVINFPELQPRPYPNDDDILSDIEEQRRSRDQ